MVLNLKILKFKTNLLVTVQAERLYETIKNLVGTSSILKTGAD